MPGKYCSLLFSRVNLNITSHVNYYVSVYINVEQKIIKPNIFDFTKVVEVQGVGKFPGSYFFQTSTEFPSRLFRRRLLLNCKARVNGG